MYFARSTTVVGTPHPDEGKRKGTTAPTAQHRREAEKWLNARKATFARLRHFDFIPPELLSLVEQFNEHAPVKLIINKTGTQAAAQFLAKATTRPDARRLAETMAACFPANHHQQRCLTASEALAVILRDSVRVLKKAKQKHEAAPIRRLKMVPRSLIARTAMCLLEASERDRCAPGFHLIALLRDLLDLENLKHAMMYRSQDQRFVSFAAYVVALVPSIGTRQLARIMNVHPSTLSRWRRSSEFARKVEQVTESLKAAKSQPLDKGKLLRLLPRMARYELPVRLAGSIPRSDGTPGFFEDTEMPLPGWWEALWPDPGGVILDVGILPGMHVIDLCSGDGWFTLQIAKVAKSVIAIDIDSALLETARYRLTEGGLHNCEYIVGDAYDVAKLSRRRADFIFIANTFHGVPDQPRLAAAVRNSLKPMGLFAVINWHQRSREETTVLGVPHGPRTELRMSPEQTREAVEAAGLQLNRVVEMPPYHYAAIFRNGSRG